MNKIKKLIAILMILFGVNYAFASTFYGPIYLQNAVTISSTTWKTVLSQTVNVTNSVYSCHESSPGFPEICLWDNSGQILAVVRDVNAATGLKYRFLVDGKASNASAPSIVNNGDGSVTLSSYTHALPNGNRVFTLQIAKKTSGSPTSVIDPTTGDAIQKSVVMTKP